VSGWWGTAALAAADAALWTVVCRDRPPSGADRRLWAHVARRPAASAPRPSPAAALAGALVHAASLLRALGSGARRRRDADLLARAGLEWDPALLDVLRIAGAAAGAGAGAVAASGGLPGGLLGWAALAGALGYLGPGVWVGRRAGARRREFQRALPDALDVLAICLRAGLGLHAAVAEYARSASGIAGEAFRRYLADLALGRTPEDGLAEMVRRYPTEDLVVASAALLQGLRLGSPLAEILQEQAAHARSLALRRAEESARQLSTRLVLPLVVFIFPQVFIIGLGPVALRLLGPGGLLR